MKIIYSMLEQRLHIQNVNITICWKIELKRQQYTIVWELQNFLPFLL